MEKYGIPADDIAQDEQQKDAKVDQIVDDLTLFDDDLMSLVFDKNIPATQLVLRIIFGRDIEVISVVGQEELKNPLVGGRDIVCESVRKYAEEYAEEKSIERAEPSRIGALAQSVKMLMQTTAVTMEQAFTNLGISDNDKKVISEKLQK